MTDILTDLRKINHLRGDTYSSAEVLGAVIRAADEIARLRAENDRLRAALKPFAKIADEVKAMHPGWDHAGFTFDVLGDRMTLAPFRAASAALSNEQKAPIDADR